jgi:DNA-directed RNA polymerase specialized sigma24 family protein
MKTNDVVLGHRPMSSSNIPSPADLDDHELVARSRAGDVEAFREIAARYYPLLRSAAYDATGSLGRSDNLARDTLVAAWRQLADLPDPAKVRSWVCGIARNLTNDFLRHRGASPGAGSFSLR